MLIAEWFSTMIIGNCLYCKKEFRKREQKYKFCSLSCSSNYNKNGLRYVTLPSYNNDLAEFVGICLGDGCVSKYQISITLNSHADKDYIPYVASLIKKLFPEPSLSIVERKDNATDIKINSSIVANFLRDMGVIPNKKIVPLWVYSSIPFRQACVRGLFDTEGSISFKRYKGKNGIVFYKQLNFRNTDVKFMKLVRDVLFEIGLKPTMTLKRSLYISNQKSLNTFLEKIGFSNPKLIHKSTILQPEVHSE
ncbi:MAG TPA: LAGLIDADG family homing endonuclease [Candidatus Saccharimonadales bacterium]|nr:LAGLIDADG family homing endonuclease [Candidatus Saccharimonadales bacterium]